jgi:hypothetical protein
MANHRSRQHLTGSARLGVSCGRGRGAPREGRGGVWLALCGWGSLEGGRGHPQTTIGAGRASHPDHPATHPATRPSGKACPAWGVTASPRRYPNGRPVSPPGTPPRYTRLAALARLAARARRARLPPPTHPHVAHQILNTLFGKIRVAKKLSPTFCGD